VKAHNIIKGLPFPNFCFDAVYHSHFLEHLTKNGAEFILKECHRVLKKGGILRVVVPDLEQKSALYLDSLRRCAQQDDGAWEDHEWMIMEIIDQFVRIQTGGEMKIFIETRNIAENEFILNRLGIEYENFKKAANLSKTFLSRLRGKSAHYITKKIYEKLSIRITGFLAFLLLGSRGLESWKIGWFKTSGEMHQWMYDRVSLTRLVIKSGFKNPIIVDHTTSQIDNWQLFQLDVNHDGSPYKPDSFYLEAQKS
jgi:predicted SAM-dependent methyltransferase